LNLRSYQTGAVENLREAIRRLDVAARPKKVLLVSPTGSGKTVIMAEIIHSAERMGSRVLFLAHRKELIDQTSRKLDDVGVRHGVIQAGHQRSFSGSQVQVASVQTLARRDKPPAEIVVIDEAHHARATTYGKILETYPGAVILGATASPWRTDGKGLKEMFEEVVVAARPRELIDAGHLVNYTGFAYDHPDLRGVERTRSDYKQAGLEIVMGSKPIVGNVVEQYRAHGGGGRAVVFAVSIAHSIALRDRFIEAGIEAEHLDGETPVGDREAILARLVAGKTRVLCNVNVLTEGVDVPNLETCILARPTQSLTLYLQMVGRVLRPACLDCCKYSHPEATVCDHCGSARIKRLGRIHDHAGCILAHGAPDLDRDYSLESDTRPKNKATAEDDEDRPLRTCEECLRIYDSADRCCPSCGHTNARQRKPPREVEGTPIPIEQLAQIAAEENRKREDKRRFLKELRETAKDRGYDKKWIGVQFKSRFGHWPTWGSVS
jgi:DNA repair protein RadD